MGSQGLALLEQPPTLRDEGRERRDVHLPDLDVAYADDPARHVHRLVHGGRTLEGHDSSLGFHGEPVPAGLGITLQGHLDARGKRPVRDELLARRRGEPCRGAGARQR